MFKVFTILFSLVLIGNLFASEPSWDFEIDKGEDTNHYSSYVFSHNYDNFLSVYCDDNQQDLYFLMQLKKEKFPQEINYVTVYFDNDRTFEYQLAVDYNKTSLFFNKSSFFIGYNNEYKFSNFIDDIKRKNTITFLSKIDGIEIYRFNLKNSFNSLKNLKENCGI